jgi:hypothetical protein
MTSIGVLRSTTTPTCGSRGSKVAAVRTTAISSAQAMFVPLGPFKNQRLKACSGMFPIIKEDLVITIVYKQGKTIL